MATTSIWPINGNIAKVIRYISNPDKTDACSFNGQDIQSLKDVMDYAVNPSKTEQQYLVSGVNCDPSIARQQMLITKQRYDKLDGRTAYHDELDAKAVNEEELTRAFNYARELFISGQLITSRKLVERFVHRVIMFHNHIEIYYNFGFSIEPIKRQVDAEIINRKRPEGVRSELLLKKDLARVSQEARAPSRVLNPPKSSGNQFLKVPIRREIKSVVCNVAGISSTSTLADAKYSRDCKRH